MAYTSSLCFSSEDCLPYPKLPHPAPAVKTRRSQLIKIVTQNQSIQSKLIDINHQLLLIGISNTFWQELYFKKKLSSIGKNDWKHPQQGQQVKAEQIFQEEWQIKKEAYLELIDGWMDGLDGCTEANLGLKRVFSAERWRLALWRAYRMENQF